MLRSCTASEGPRAASLITCGNRPCLRPPDCSRLYVADTYHLIRAGLSGGKNVPNRPHPGAQPPAPGHRFSERCPRRSSDAAIQPDDGDNPPLCAAPVR